MPLPSKPTKTLEVFFSYSHKDEELRDELSKHLTILKRRQVISGWHDRRIGAGREWEKEIDTHLNAAHIVLLLVSSDFLASDYCYDVEVKRAMERHDAGEVRVIPVILRDVNWKGAPFSKLNALPKDGRAVTSWPNRDEAFRNVAEGITQAVDELMTRQVDHLFAKLVNAGGNWHNVIDIGERILNVLPEHQPTRSKVSAAYINRWADKISYEFAGVRYVDVFNDDLVFSSSKTEINRRLKELINVGDNREKIERDTQAGRRSRSK